MSGRRFMDETKYEAMEPPDQVRELAQPPLQKIYEPECIKIDLPMPEHFPQMKPVDFLALIELRASVRDYSTQPMPLLELSFLLWCSQGIKMVLGDKATKRTVPSAGSRHALETYLLINNVEGVEPGLYRFLAIEHKLTPVLVDAGVKERLVEACMGQQFIGKSAVCFLWSAVAYRMTWRYGERGYRYLHLDAGHACQNLYLAAQVIDYGVCALATFDDDRLNKEMLLDGKEEFIIYAAAVGKI